MVIKVLVCKPGGSWSVEERIVPEDWFQVTDESK